MGRTVSVPSRAAVVMYVVFEHAWGYDSEPQDSDEENAKADCQSGYCSCWDDFVGNFRYSVRDKINPLEDCDEWLDREDHAILENEHIHIGISEYCGMVSLWIVPKEASDYETDDYDAINKANATFALLAYRPFMDAVKESCGEPWRKVGTFSNGEGVYERMAA